VSRTARSDADAHALMLVSSVLPGDLLKQLGMSPANAWGVLRWLIELVRKHAKNLQDEGVPPEEYVAKFVLMRDPNKPAVHFYAVPADAFEGEAAGGEEAAVAADEESAWAASKPRA